jgi:hypothetical protein
MPAALSLNSSESQRVQKYAAAGGGAGRRAVLRWRYSLRRTMFSINGVPVRNLILFIRLQFLAEYSFRKPRKHDGV